MDDLLSNWARAYQLRVRVSDYERETAQGYKVAKFIDHQLLENEVDILATRAQGAGGQNVNKVSNAVHLRFDIRASSLPIELKERLLTKRDQRINDDGVVVIKAQTHRSLDKNRAEALARLRQLIASVASIPRKRVPTKPTASAQKKRVETKVRRGQVKAQRRRVIE